MASDHARQQFVNPQIHPAFRHQMEPPHPPPAGLPPPTPTQPPLPFPAARSHTVPQPQLSEQLSQLQLTSSHDLPRKVSTPNVAQAAVAASVTPPLPVALPVVALTIPDEKNPAPFCKSSVRLFLHPLHLKPYTSKAFTSAQRPLGMNNMVPYWRCDKCLFEGPMSYAPGPSDKKGRPGKQEKIFDGTIRDSVNAAPGGGVGTAGVRYKWAFLAKCHVPLKQVPEGKRDGSFGGFACLFCTAEGNNRGWLGGSTGGMDVMSIRSGQSSTNTPVFGNLQSFMDHLQLHRKAEYWPGLEMQGRMKCVVGRVARRDEDFDVNFIPLELSEQK